MKGGVAAHGADAARGNFSGAARSNSRDGTMQSPGLYCRPAPYRRRTFPVVSIPRSRGIPFIVILAVISAAWLDPYRDAVSSGNREFQEKKYNGAKRYYRKARRYAPGQEYRKKLSFNQGDAEYMLEDYEVPLQTSGAPSSPRTGMSRRRPSSISGTPG